MIRKIKLLSSVSEGVLRHRSINVASGGAFRANSFLPATATLTVFVVALEKRWLSRHVPYQDVHTPRQVSICNNDYEEYTYLNHQDSWVQIPCPPPECSRSYLCLIHHEVGRRLFPREMHALSSNSRPTRRPVPTLSWPRYRAANMGTLAGSIASPTCSGSKTFFRARRAVGASDHGNRNETGVMHVTCT